MSRAEGDAFTHQVVGEIRSQQKRIGCGGPHCGGAGLHAINHFGENLERQLQRVHGIKEPLLVLLEIAIVRHGESLERGQQADEISQQPAGLATGEFGDVRIFLLRHQARAGGVRIAQRDEAKFRADPQNDILAQS